MRKLISVVMVLVFATSCSAEENFSANNLPPETLNTIEEVSGTNGELIPIISSNVIAAGYDSRNEIMKVQFKNGSLYEYYGVKLELWESFIGAQPSPWSEVGFPRLVQGGFQYRKVN